MDGERSWTERVVGAFGGLDILAGCTCSPHRSLEAGYCHRGSDRPEGELDIASLAQAEFKAKFHPFRSSASPELHLVSTSSGEDRHHLKVCPESRNDSLEDWQGLENCNSSPLALQLGDETPPGMNRRRPMPLPDSDVCTQTTVQTPEASKVPATLPSSSVKHRSEHTTLKQHIAVPEDKPVEDSDGFGEFQAAFRMDTIDSDGPLFDEFQAASALQDDDEKSPNLDEEHAKDLASIREADFSAGMCAKADNAAASWSILEDTILSQAEDSCRRDVPSHMEEEAPDNFRLSADKITGALSGAIDAEYRYVRQSLHTGGVPVNMNCAALNASRSYAEGSSRVDCDDPSYWATILLREGCSTANIVDSPSEGVADGDDRVVTETRLGTDLPCGIVSATCTSGEGCREHRDDAACRLGSCPRPNSEEDQRRERLALVQDKITPLTKQGEAHLSSSKHSNRLVKLLLCRCGSICS